MPRYTAWKQRHHFAGQGEIAERERGCSFVFFFSSKIMEEVESLKIFWFGKKES